MAPETNAHEAIKYMLVSWKPASILSKCHQRGVTKWQVIDYLNAPVYMAKQYVGNDDFIVDVRGCRLCGAEFDLRYSVGHYITRKQCSCGDNGTKSATLEKFKVYLPEEKAKNALHRYNLSKTKGFTTTTRSWVAKGHSQQEAEDLVRQEQASRSAKSPAARKGATDYSVRSTGYWVADYKINKELVIKTCLNFLGKQ